MPVITVRIKYHLFFPILLRAARQWACIDVMTSALQCTTFVLIVLIRRRRTFASWVILIGCAKTDESITGNITGSFCIFLLANPVWPSYVVLQDRLAIKTLIKQEVLIGHFAVFPAKHHSCLFIIFVLFNCERTLQAFVAKLHTLSWMCLHTLHFVCGLKNAVIYIWL